MAGGQRQRADQQRHGQAEADEEANQAAPPIEAAPQRQEEQRIEDQAPGKAQQESGQQRAAIGLDGPDQQRRRNHVTDQRRGLGRVGQHQVQAGGGHAGVHVVEVPVADQHHAQHHRQVGQDRRDADRQVADFARWYSFGGGVSLVGKVLLE